MSQDVMDALNETSAHPAAKFENKGDGVVGTIIGPEPFVRLGTNKFSGEEEKTVIIHLETADGPRTVYANKYAQKRAITDALEEAKKKTGDNSIRLGLGGKFGLKYDSDLDVGKPSPAKVFKALYEPPVSSGVTTEEIF